MATDDQNNERTLFKIVIVGHEKSGKSHLMAKLLKENYPDNYQRTIGIEFGLKYSDDPKLINQFWDIGAKEFMELNTKPYDWTPIYLANVHACLLVIDSSDTKSLAKAEKILGNIRQRAADAPIFLIANKTDLNSAISDAALNNFVQKHKLARLIKASAKVDTTEELTTKLIEPLNNHLLSDSNQSSENHTSDHEDQHSRTSASLIERLENYTRRPYRKSITQANYRFGFWIRKQPRAFNRMINTKLAEALLNEVRNNDNLHDLFESESLSKRRAELVKQYQNTKGYNTRGKYYDSKHLKKIIHDARRISSKNHTDDTESDTTPLLN